jgi:hypothetical protein
VKAELRTRGLTPTSQLELAAVAAYFDARTHVAHAAISIVAVVDSTQIFRLFAGPTPTVDLITVDDLRAECEIAAVASLLVGTMAR